MSFPSLRELIGVPKTYEERHSEFKQRMESDFLKTYERNLSPDSVKRANEICGPGFDHHHHLVYTGRLGLAERKALFDTFWKRGYYYTVERDPIHLSKSSVYVYSNVPDSMLTRMWCSVRSIVGLLI